MNDKKRKLLKKSTELLGSALSIIEDVVSDEEDCISNLPESLESSEMYCKMEDAIDTLGCIAENIESSIDEINSVM